jgi:hypothetical protein
LEEEEGGWWEETYVVGSRARTVDQGLALLDGVVGDVAGSFARHGCGFVVGLGWVVSELTFVCRRCGGLSLGFVGRLVSCWNWSCSEWYWLEEHATRNT